MKIGSVSHVSPVNPYADVARKNKVAAAGIQSADKAEFTENARLFANVLKAAKETPEVRVDRVESLKAQIARGDYKVSAAGVAGKLLTRL